MDEDELYEYYDDYFDDEVERELIDHELDSMARELEEEENYD